MKVDCKNVRVKGKVRYNEQKPTLTNGLNFTVI
jgi:hypothetical protein